MGKRGIPWNKKYSGLWVAIAEEEILTSGKLEEVMKEVEASGKKQRFFKSP